MDLQAMLIPLHFWCDAICAFLQHGPSASAAEQLLGAKRNCWLVRLTWRPEIAGTTSEAGKESERKDIGSTAVDTGKLGAVYSKWIGKPEDSSFRKWMGANGTERYWDITTNQGIWETSTNKGDRRYYPIFFLEVKGVTSAAG